MSVAQRQVCCEERKYFERAASQMLDISNCRKGIVDICVPNALLPLSASSTLCIVVHTRDRRRAEGNAKACRASIGFFP